VTSVEDNNYSK